MRYPLLCLLLSPAACAANLHVTSAPLGARVLVDGADTGEVTPADLSARDIGRGDHSITVALEGHGPTAAQPVSVATSFRNVAGSVIFPIPVIPVNIVRGYADASPRKMHFELKPIDR